MTDEEFEEMLRRFKMSDGVQKVTPDLTSYKFTPEQITRLCVISTSDFPDLYLDEEQILQYLMVSPTDIDLFIGSSHFWDRLCVLMYCPSLLPYQMDKLLTDSSIDVRADAVSHPCCTDEQKVAYHLKYGDS